MTGRTPEEMGDGPTDRYAELADLLALVMSPRVDRAEIVEAIESAASGVLGVPAHLLVGGPASGSRAATMSDLGGTPIDDVSFTVDGGPEPDPSDPAVGLLTAIAAAALEHRRVHDRADVDRTRMSAISDALPGGILVRSADGRLDYANRWMREYARRHTALDGDDPSPLVDELHRPLAPDQYPSHRARRGETFDLVVVGLPLAEGEIRWLNTSGRPLVDAAGRTVGGLIVVTDVTDRVRFRRDLQRSEQLLRDTERLARRGSWRRDVVAGETHVSDGFRALCGLGADADLSRERLYGAFHPDDRGLIFEATYRTFTEGTPFKASVRLLGPDGAAVPVELEARRYDDADGEPRGLVGTVRDLTGELEHQERMARADRMEMVGRLAGGVAHDFNNLLTVLTGHAELIRDGASDEQRASLDTMAAAIGRAAVLTRQLLEFGRRDVLQARPTDVVALVDQVGSMARGAVPTSITLAVERPDVPCVAVVDPAKIEQVLLNLVLNARDASGDGGRIVLRTAPAELSDGDHPDLPPGRYVHVEVCDDGTGMDEEVLRRAPEPFFTTKPAGAGTGLGLATSSGIIAQSGGSLTLTSEEGSGTRASVLLPWSDESPATRTDAETGDGSRMTGPVTLLLAEDEDHLRPLLERVLRARGHRVLVGADGEDALQVAATAGGTVDLLVTDVSMPRRSGPALAEALLAVHPAMRVIYMSGYTEQSDLLHSLPGRDLDFLAKPFPMSQLVALVDEVLSRSPTPVEDDPTGHGPVS